MMLWNRLSQLMVRVRRSSVFRYGAASLIPRGLAILTTLIVTPLAVHSMGVAGYGVWVLATQVPSVIASPDLGVTQGLINELVEENRLNGGLKGSRDRLFEVQRVLGFVAGCWLIIGTVGSYVYTSSAGPAAEQRTLFVSMVTAAALFSASVPAMVWARAQLAQQRGQETLLVEGIGKAGALVSCCIVLLAAPHPVALVVAFMLPTTGAAWLNSWLYTRREFGGMKKRARQRGIVSAVKRNGSLFGRGSMFVVMQIAYLMNTAIDPYIVGGLAGSADVAYVSVVRRPFDVLPLIVTMFSPALWPVFSRLGAARERRRLINLTGVFAVVTLSAIAGLSAAILVFRTAIYSYLSAGIIEPPLIDLVAVALLVLSTAYINIPSTLLNSLDKLRAQAALLLGGSVVSMVLKIVALSAGGVSAYLLAAAATQLLLIAVPLTIASVYAVRKLGGEGSLPIES